jgi:dTDP-4-amino-4,6-dideoxygalactose transaminase
MKRFLPYSRQNIDRSDIKSIVKVLKSDFITQGPNINKFEKEFAKYVGAKYAVCCATGTAALHLACLALGINSKSRVLTSAITFVASANCAEFLGASIVFADIDEETNCMSIIDLEKKLKKQKIDLVIPVHLAGHSADMKKIYQLKKKI